MDVGNKFDKNVRMFTLLISLSFVIRSSSPIGWVPLLVIKIFADNSFVPFLISGFLIAIPVIAFGIMIDTWYYG